MLWDYYLNAFATLFVTIDPIALAPVFLVLTEGLDRATRRTMGLRGALTAALVLLGFALVGEPVLGFLGITVAAFRIGGGLLLFWTAFEMVFGGREQRRRATGEDAAAELAHRMRAAIFPLAIPLIAGPGAISATILQASRAPNVLGFVGLVVIIAGLIGLCYLVFLTAYRIDRYLGDTGRTVLTRLLGIILAALAVQFVLSGLAEFVATGAFSQSPAEEVAAAL